MASSRVSQTNLDGHSRTQAHTTIALGGEFSVGITLALGGGFARGFAHLGVLSVLEQDGIPISAIVGTSIGGLLGAAYADGIPVSDLCDLGRAVRVRDLLRFDRSAQGDEPAEDCISRFVRDRFQATNLEELLIRTAIVATNLDTGAPYVFSKGPIQLAARAGCAFPGLLRPVKLDGCLIADGCIAAPVPAEIAAKLTGGYVLAINVDPSSAAPSSSSTQSAAKIATGDSASSRNRSDERSWLRHADIVLEPLVQKIHWNDFSRVDEAFEAGAEAMRSALPAVRDILSRRSQWAPAQDVCGCRKEGRAQ